MNCPRCSAPTVHVPQYQMWFCQSCQAYVPLPKVTSGVNLWLVVGLPLGLLAIGIGAFLYLTTQSFKRYVDKSKTGEVHESLRQIQRGARMYFDTAHVEPGTMKVIEGQLPGPRAGLTPATPCCEHGGKCQPDIAAWEDDPVWRALGFGLYGSHYYQYEYELDPDGKGFTARAFGDLDCDGVMSTFEVQGRVEGGELEVNHHVREHLGTE
jgi:hypothetical protein